MAGPIRNNVSPGVQPQHQDQPKPYECSLCLSIMQDAVMANPCGHSYCTPCITEARKISKSCPLCRQEITEVIVNRAMRDVIDAKLKKQSQAQEKKAAPVVAPAKSPQEPKIAPVYDPKNFDAPPCGQQALQPAAPRLSPQEQAYRQNLADPTQRDYILDCVMPCFNLFITSMPTILQSNESHELLDGHLTLEKANRLLDIVQAKGLWQEFFQAWDKAGYEHVRPHWFSSAVPPPPRAADIAPHPKVPPAEAVAAAPPVSPEKQALAMDRAYILTKFNGGTFPFFLSDMPTVSRSMEARELRSGYYTLEKANRLLDIVQDKKLWQEFFRAWDKAGLAHLRPPHLAKHWC